MTFSARILRRWMDFFGSIHDLSLMYSSNLSIRSMIFTCSWLSLCKASVIFSSVPVLALICSLRTHSHAMVAASVKTFEMSESESSMHRYYHLLGDLEELLEGRDGHCGIRRGIQEPTGNHDHAADKAADNRFRDTDSHQGQCEHGDARDQDEQDDVGPKLRE